MGKRTVAVVPSSSSHARYHVSHDDTEPLDSDAGYGCSCIGWTRHVPRKDCKHIKDFKKKADQAYPNWVNIVLTDVGDRVVRARRGQPFTTPRTALADADGPPPRQERVWPPPIRSLSSTTAQPSQPSVVAPVQDLPLRDCPTCDKRHAGFCKADDVEAKQRREEERRGNPLRYKLLEVD